MCILGVKFYYLLCKFKHEKLAEIFTNVLLSCLLATQVWASSHAGNTNALRCHFDLGLIYISWISHVQSRSTPGWWYKTGRCLIYPLTIHGNHSSKFWSIATTTIACPQTKSVVVMTRAFAMKKRIAWIRESLRISEQRIVGVKKILKFYVEKLNFQINKYLNFLQCFLGSNGKE